MMTTRRLRMGAVSAAMLFVSCGSWPALDASPDARSVITRYSGGPAPIRLAVLEVYSNGCVRYRRFHVSRRACTADLRGEVESGALSSRAVAGAFEALRLAPRTHFDADEIGLSAGANATGIPVADMPAAFRNWIHEVDRVLERAIGAEYVSLAAPLGSYD